MRLDDEEQAKYEALAEAASLAIEPVVKIAEMWADSHGQAGFERALDTSVLAIMDLVDKAYRQGKQDQLTELTLAWEGT